MPRLSALVVFAALLVLTGFPLGAQEGAGSRDIALGREALARQEYAVAVDHLERGVLALDPVRDAPLVAEIWLQVGIAWLNGLDHPEHALPAFLSSAGSAADPSTAWLWASVTAEKLGRTEEALMYRARALSPQTPAPDMPATSTPEPEPAPVAPTPIPEPEPEPAPAAPAPVAEPVEAPKAPEEKPDAIQHFFGPKAEEPVPAPEPPPAGEPEEPIAGAEAPPQEAPQQEAPRQEAPREKPDAVQHFFGPKAVEEPAPEAKPEEPAQAEEKVEEKKKVDAFQHFFGEKEKDEPEAEAEEKPPA